MEKAQILSTDFIVASGDSSDSPHGLLVFSLGAMAVGTWFLVMGIQMSKLPPEARGYDFPHLAISGWRRRPKLSMIMGSFWILVGLLVLTLYILWLVGLIGPGN